MADQPRICFTVLIDQFNEHGYIPSVVTEGEAGHSPCIGNGELAQPWYWGTDYKKAQEICVKANADLGLTPDDVTTIIGSSMAAGNRQAGRLAEAGLGDTDSRVKSVRSRLIKDGVIT